MRGLAFLLFSITITYAERCRVFPTRQEAFCQYDYVTHAKVLSIWSEYDVNGILVFNYGIKHIEIFKKPMMVSGLPEEVASASPSVPGLNGVELVVGKEYVLSGYLLLDGPWHWLQNCPVMERLLTEWDQLLPEEKEALRTYTCPEP